MTSPFAKVQIADLEPGDSMGQVAIPPKDEEVHLWQFRSQVSSGLSDFEALLSADERQRASRFHFVRDAHRFTVARAHTRLILSAYLQADPRDVQFVHSKHGKPRIASAQWDIRFNVSHSGDQAMVAVASQREVGVDIEQIRSNVECEQLAERFFSPGERNLISGLPEDEKLQAFFRLWTCKEAFLKAHGAGLSRSLSSFDVKLGSSPGQLLIISGDAGEEEKWRLVEVETGSGYRAAAVVEGILAQMSVFRLQPR